MLGEATVQSHCAFTVYSLCTVHCIAITDSIHAQFEKNCLDIYVDGHNLELCSLDPNRLFAVGSLSCLDIGEVLSCVLYRCRILTEGVAFYLLTCTALHCSTVSLSQSNLEISDTVLRYSRWSENEGNEGIDGLFIGHHFSGWTHPAQRNGSNGARHKSRCSATTECGGGTESETVSIGKHREKCIVSIAAAFVVSSGNARCDALIDA